MVSLIALLQVYAILAAKRSMDQRVPACEKLWKKRFQFLFSQWKVRRIAMFEQKSKEFSFSPRATELGNSSKFDEFMAS